MRGLRPALSTFLFLLLITGGVCPLADAVTSSTGTFVLASGLAARNAATRAAICLSSSGLLTARLLPPEACGL